VKFYYKRWEVETRGQKFPEIKIRRNNKKYGRKRNKEREEMLNAKSITGRVDRSVAALYRRADYIRSQAAEALEGGISEAQGPKNDGNVSVNNSGEGSPKESGDAEGGG
jgi:hypothetical protein